MASQQTVQDSIKIEAVTQRIELGEGPFWDHKKGILYFVNLYASEVHSYEPKTKEHKWIKIGGEPVTFVIPLLNEEGRFLISIGRDVHILNWDGKSQSFSVNPHISIEGRKDSRMNDAKASPSHVLFAGSMGNEQANGFIPDKQGSLYVVKDGKVKVVIDEVGISNGLGWNLDETELYWNDTLTNKCYKFKYDRRTNEISDQTLLVDFEAKKIKGLPDGMAVDTEGYLWIACLKGGQIIKVDPKTGDVLFSLQVPCPDITSLAFGGSDFDTLYCTTSTHNVAKKDLTPESGCLLKITGLRSRGLPSVPVKL